MRDELDVITLRGLTARGHHGVFPFEREGSQPFSADVSLWVDTRAAASTDDIDSTVSYADIAEEAVAVLTGPSVYLLETLAQRIAEVALSHPQVQGVEVTIHKPMAPLRQQFSDVSVTIRRGAALEGPRASAVPSSSSLPSSQPHRPDDEGAPTPATAGEPGGGRPVVVESRAPMRRRSGAIPADDSTWTPVVLALGGNVGDVPVTLAQAVEALTEVGEVHVEAVSPLVRTAPVLEAGQAPQDDYWNAVVLARTSLSPDTLLEVAEGIEESLGRVRHEHWGARTVDIDIIQVQGVTSDSPELTLPHPRAAHRAFVLVPWSLVDPSALLTGVGPVAELAQEAPDLAGVRDAVDDWLEDPSGLQEDSDAHLEQTDRVPAPAADEVTPPVPAPTPEPAPTADRESPEEDFLWQQLWAHHSQTPVHPEAPRASAAKPVDPGSVAPVTPAGSVPVRPGTARPGPEESPEHSASAQETPPSTPAAPAPSAPTAAGARERPTTAPATPGASRPPRRGPRWLPVRERETTGADPDADAGEDVGDVTSAAGTDEGPVLPEWDFAHSTEPRIVDDAQAFTADDSATAAGGSHGAVHRRSILDPDLPPSVPTGPREQDPTTQTSIRRGLTVRPSVTGQQPVIRHRGRRDRA